MLQQHQRVGDFEIVRPLGKGGMGEVYEAQQFHPPRRVALKVLAPWLTLDPAALERFRREIEVPARLDHPAIVRIFSAGQTPDGLAYYTMHLVRGLTLRPLMPAASAGPPVAAPVGGSAPREFWQMVRASSDGPDVGEIPTASRDAPSEETPTGSEA